VRAAVERVVSQLDRPLVDTWGCSRHGHVAAHVERLGVVASAAQQIAEHSPETRQVYREHLVAQLAELAVNAIVMLVEEMATLRDDEAPDARGVRT
jgi:hypothetical protein